jgi:hypothetical protein
MHIFLQPFRAYSFFYYALLLSLMPAQCFGDVIDITPRWYATVATLGIFLPSLQTRGLVPLNTNK